MRLIAKTCKAGGIESPESISPHELLTETNLKLSLIDLASCPLQNSELGTTPAVD